jgi:ubiquinone/menaquinone biosynthesis C-methylase UbiE
MADQPANKEVYSQRDNPAFETLIATRTAAREAAFFLPHLRPGMCLLDVGCGPGSITLGLADAVVTGEVVGIDMQQSQVQQACHRAVERGVANVRFEVGDAYRLPFPDRSFDAVFAHAVMLHLREPVRALVEMRRVLHQGGIVGVREPDHGTMLIAPATPLLDEWLALMNRKLQHLGGNPFVGRHLRGLLMKAEFARAEVSSSTHTAGSHEETRRAAAFLKSWSTQTPLAEGWVTQATVNAMWAEFDAWAERPDAFFVVTFCEAVGWRGE